MLPVTEQPARARNGAPGPVPVPLAYAPVLLERRSVAFPGPCARPAIGSDMQWERRCGIASHTESAATMLPASRARPAIGLGMQWEHSRCTDSYTADSVALLFCMDRRSTDCIEKYSSPLFLS